MPRFTLSCPGGFASVQRCFTTQVALTYYPDIFKAHSNQQLRDIFMLVPGGQTLRPSDRIYGCKYALTNSSPSKCMLTEYIRENTSEITQERFLLFRLNLANSKTQQSLYPIEV